MLTAYSVTLHTPEEIILKTASMQNGTIVKETKHINKKPSKEFMNKIIESELKKRDNALKLTELKSRINRNKKQNLLQKIWIWTMKWILFIFEPILWMMRKHHD